MKIIGITVRSCSCTEGGLVYIFRTQFPHIVCVCVCDVHCIVLTFPFVHVMCRWMLGRWHGIFTYWHLPFGICIAHWITINVFFATTRINCIELFINMIYVYKSSNLFNWVHLIDFVVILKNATWQGRNQLHTIYYTI